MARGRTLTVGRDPQCDIVLPPDATSVSRVHARVHVLGGGRFRIEDAGTANGLHVDGRRVPSAEIGYHERVTLGSFVFDLETLRPYDASSSAGAGGRWLVIGRDPSCDIVVASQVTGVSRRHAEFRLLPDGRAEVRDLQSGSGLFVDGRRVSTAVVDRGRRVTLGSHPVTLFPQERPAPHRPRVAGASRAPWLIAAAVLASFAGLVWRASAPEVTASTAASARSTSAPAGTPAEIFERYAASVVVVEVGAGMGAALGSGFFVDSSGLLVTNQHVIADGGRVIVRMLGGAEVRAEVVATDSFHDLAVLRAQLSGRATPVRLGDSDAIQIGEQVVAIGNPIGLEHTITDGVVSARRDIQGRELIQMSVPISQGNSGGPVFNMSGEVIGVAVGTIDGTAFGVSVQNVNLAVPVSDVRALLAQSR